MRFDAPFILASRSPRRRLLLEKLGWPFRVVPSHVDEMMPDDTAPSSIVQRLASDKAEAVAAQHRNALTLGADTIVVYDGDILGKPADDDEAHGMLRRLSGHTHTVFTGIALVHPASHRTFTSYEATDVTFADLSDEEIAAYVHTRSPFDKAGGYGIQDDMGALFVARIDGDYYNVVGLPLHNLYKMLHAHYDDLFAL